MFNSQEQLLSTIAELVEDVIYTNNPNPLIYKDRDGKPLIGGNQYHDDLLEETLIPVWNIHGQVYMVRRGGRIQDKNKHEKFILWRENFKDMFIYDMSKAAHPEFRSYFVFTEKHFKRQFNKGTLKSL